MRRGTQSELTYTVSITGAPSLEEVGAFQLSSPHGQGSHGRRVLWIPRVWETSRRRDRLEMEDGISGAFQDSEEPTF